LKSSSRRKSEQSKESLEKVERERLYGTVSLKYSAGRLELIRKEKTIKPTERIQPMITTPKDNDDVDFLTAKAYQCAVREEGKAHALRYLHKIRDQKLFLSGLPLLHAPEAFSDIDLEAIVDAQFERQKETGKTTRAFWGLEPEDEFVFLSAKDIVEYRELDRDGFILGPCSGGRDGIFAARSLHLIQGASASGKTTFALQMLRAQQEGKPFCGR
jgi:hypothetical protein